ncbi:RNA-directed DNA polymerase, eukaryota [Tanacetum coccineum]
MSSFRSKEDHVIRLSKSIFVTNFPENFGSSDLWKLCEAYGKVVDVYIPNRKSKAGKRFDPYPGSFVNVVKGNHSNVSFASVLESFTCSNNLPGRRAAELFSRGGCVLWKPSRDFTRPHGPPSGLKGLLHTLNATVIPTKAS